MYTSMPGPAAEAGVGAAVQRARRRRFRLGLCRWRQELQRLGQRLYRRWELCLGGSTLKHLTAAAARAMEAVWWELLVGAALHNIKYDKGPEARTLDTLLKISDLGPLAGPLPPNPAVRHVSRPHSREACCPAWRPYSAAPPPNPTAPTLGSCSRPPGAPRASDRTSAGSCRTGV